MFIFDKSFPIETTVEEDKIDKYKNIQSYPYKINLLDKKK